jgi:hypothetical protein
MGEEGVGLKQVMSWTHLDDPQHWRERAEEARYVARHMIDSTSSEMVFVVATTYERLAQRAQERRATS